VAGIEAPSLIGAAWPARHAKELVVDSFIQVLKVCTYYDVRFKYPWRGDGFFPSDAVVFDKFTGYRRFCVGVNVDHTFSYLKIYDERGGIRFESELSNIELAGIESLIQWRLSTPAAVLNSMAVACLGPELSMVGGSKPKRISKFSVNDASFTLPMAQLGRDALIDSDCVVLIEKSSQKCVSQADRGRELVVFAMAEQGTDMVR